MEGVGLNRGLGCFVENVMGWGVSGGEKKVMLGGVRKNYREDGEDRLIIWFMFWGFLVVWGFMEWRKWRGKCFLVNDVIGGL